MTYTKPRGSKFRDHGRRLRIPRMLTLSFYARLVTFPVQLLISSWKNQRTQDLLLGLPALAGIIIIPILIGKAQIQRPSLSVSYYEAAQAAMAEQDYPRAELLLDRVLERGDAHFSDAQYSMAVLLDETGEKERASELFSILAPDNEHGNRDAHRHLAIILADQVTAKSDPEDIQRLFWHLNATGRDESAAMSMAWGRYYLAVRDLPTAKKHFEDAVDEFPDLWQTIGTMEALAGNASAAEAGFRRSSEYLEEKLSDHPEDDQTRIRYARVLIQLGQLDRSAQVLEEGRRLNPEGPWPSMLANLAVNYHDLRVQQQASISELLGYLDKALSYEPNCGPALQRLMSYATAKVSSNATLRQVLARVIAEAKKPALAHVAMGNLCWMEDDRKQAVFHFERALDIRDDMSILLNNLAWIVAHDEQQPDLDRALGLVTSALEKHPDHPDFLDTRGTIHMLQENWEAASTDFEKALASTDDKQAIHGKLAKVYGKLGFSEISAEHQRLAGENPQ